MHWLLASSSIYRASLLNKLNFTFDQCSPDIDEKAYHGENALQLSMRLSFQKALKVASNNPNLSIIASDQSAQIVTLNAIQNDQLAPLTALCLNSNSNILSKPLNHQTAVKQLTELSGNVAVFLTGLCVLCPTTSISSKTAKNRIEKLSKYSIDDVLINIQELSDSKTRLNVSMEFLIDINNAQSNHKTTYFCQLLIEPFYVHFRQLSKQNIDHYISLEKPFDCAGSFKSEGLGIVLFTKMQGDDPNSLIGLPLIRLIDCINNIGVDILG